jgi:HD-GYP domain-containing protein (c-di-GMP phosphodiesterase class II)
MSDTPHTAPTVDPPPPSDASTPTQADQELALSLAAAIRTAGYFEADNAVMMEVSSALAGHIVGRTEREGFLRVGTHSHCVFVGPARIRTSLATFERFASLMQVFADREINVINFHPGVSQTELARLAMALAQEGVRGPEEVNARLRQQGVVHVDVDVLSTGSGVHAVAPVEAYSAAVQLGEKLREAAERARHIDMRHARHVTQAIVDQILDAPKALIALTTIKEMDQQLVSHSGNVAILSVLLGQRLGMSKARLGELCLAGFLHDAGKLEVAPDALGKPGPLDPQEWEEVRKHPLLAARGLLAGRGLTPATMRAVVVAYEHHLNYDMSGYPESKIHDHISLYGNIVSIADRYDALTTARAYRRFSFSPHEVVGYLVHYMGTSFDPMLVKLFIEMMGIYPPGTLLRLSDGDVGVVCEPPASGDPLDRPKVRMWTGMRTGEVIDLAQGEGAALEITMVLSPAGMGQVPAIELSAFEVSAEARPLTTRAPLQTDPAQAPAPPATS